MSPRRAEDRREFGIFADRRDTLIVHSPEMGERFSDVVGEDEIDRLLRESQTTARLGFRRRLLASIIASDGPGLLAQICSEIEHRGLNVEGASAESIGDQALLQFVLSSDSPVQPDSLETSLERAIEGTNLTADIRIELLDDTPALDLTAFEIWHSYSRSPDTLGSLARIAQIFADAGCWIHSFSTRVVRGPSAELPQCVVDMNVALPAEVDRVTLRRQIDQYRDDVLDAFGEEAPGLYSNTLRQVAKPIFVPERGSVATKQGEIGVVAVGQARPGLVAAIAGRFSDLRLTITSSTMAILEGRSTFIFVLDPSQAAADLDVDGELRQLGEDLNIQITARPHSSPRRDRGPRRGPIWELNVQTDERPGVLAEVARSLFAAGADVTRLEARVARGAPSVCTIGMFLRIDSDDAHELGAALDSIASQLGWGFTLEEMQGARFPLR